MHDSRSSFLGALVAHLQREWHAVFASRIAWAYASACLLWGVLGSPLFGANRSDGVTWFLLPALLYGIPLAGVLAGVVAWQGDAGEEDLLVTRCPRRLASPLGKWLCWACLLSAATLFLILPGLPTAASPAVLVGLWTYSIGEIAIFVAFGLAIGRLFRDPVLAHSLALVAGMAFVAGGGVILWVAAYQPFLQKEPNLWTLLLMLHPVEALRISLMFSLENLPFDPRQLPGLAAWWLRHPGGWFGILTAIWSLAGILLVGLRRPVHNIP